MSRYSVPMLPLVFILLLVVSSRQVHAPAKAQKTLGKTKTVKEGVVVNSYPSIGPQQLALLVANGYMLGRKTM